MHSLYRREVSEQKAWSSCLAHELDHMLCSPHALLPKPHDLQNTSVPTVKQLLGPGMQRKKSAPKLEVEGRQIYG